ncbi:hypothetical protein [Nocardioides sp. YIM 152588]|uniref:hypothetical protein n=1 Tax=Nocardioides sp. YIM 152588 TaxID=3158259 RepID=UPI0032E378E4
MTAEPAPNDGVDEPDDRLEEVARRLDETGEAVAGLDEAARRVATAAIDARDDLHRAVLTTLVRRLKGDPRGKELLFELIDDPEVRLVLMVHGILRPAATPAPAAPSRPAPALIPLSSIGVGPPGGTQAGGPHP